MDFTKLADFYTKQIKENLLPFWIAKAIDYEYGGYFTCFDNYGKELLSHDKYTWSQGRMIWILSRLSTMNDIFKLATPISNGGLILAPPGHFAGYA